MGIPSASRNVNQQNVNGNYTVDYNDDLVYCDATAGGFAVALYTVDGGGLHQVIVAKDPDDTTANTITITGLGFTFSISQPNASVVCQTDFNGDWFAAGSSGGSGDSLTTKRITINPTPTFNLAGNVLAVAELITWPAFTVAAGKQFDAIRIDGIGTPITLGSGTISSGISSYVEAGSGSVSNTTLYSGVLHVDNAGPGTVKALHALASGSGSSTGVLAAGQFQMVGLATSSTASAAIMISNTGAADVVSGLSINSTGVRFRHGIGTEVAPTLILNAYYQAWMATGSATNARAFQVLDNGGTEIGYIQKDAKAVFPSIGLGTTPGAGLLINGEYSNAANNIAGQFRNTNSSGITSVRMLNDIASTVEFGIRGSARASYGALVAGDGYFYSDNSITIMADDASGTVKITAGGNVEKARVDATAVADETSLMLWDVNSGTLKRVSVGIADSGGVGFRLLRIPN